MADSTSPSVLVVNNSIEIATLLKIIFERSGYPHTVHIFQSSSQALGWLQLQETLPELAIVDYMVLMLSGAELYERALTDPTFHDLPFIFLTRSGTYMDAELYELYQKYSPLPYPFNAIQLPFSPSDLLARIKSVLGRTPRESEFNHDENRND